MTKRPFQNDNFTEQNQKNYGTPSKIPRVSENLGEISQIKLKNHEINTEVKCQTKYDKKGNHNESISPDERKTSTLNLEKFVNEFKHTSGAGPSTSLSQLTHCESISPSESKTPALKPKNKFEEKDKYTSGESPSTSTSQLQQCESISPSESKKPAEKRKKTKKEKDKQRTGEIPLTSTSQLQHCESISPNESKTSAVKRKKKEKDKPRTGEIPLTSTSQQQHCESKTSTLKCKKTFEEKYKHICGGIPSTSKSQLKHYDNISPKEIKTSDFNQGKFMDEFKHASGAGTSTSLSLLTHFKSILYSESKTSQLKDKKIFDEKCKLTPGDSFSTSTSQLQHCESISPRESKTSDLNLEKFEDEFKHTSGVDPSTSLSQLTHCESILYSESQTSQLNDKENFEEKGKLTPDESPSASTSQLQCCESILFSESKTSQLKNKEKFDEKGKLTLGVSFSTSTSQLQHCGSKTSTLKGKETFDEKGKLTPGEIPSTSTSQPQHCESISPSESKTSDLNLEKFVDEFKHTSRAGPSTSLSQLTHCKSILYSESKTSPLNDKENFEEKGKLTPDESPSASTSQLQCCESISPSESKTPVLKPKEKFEEKDKYTSGESPSTSTSQLQNCESNSPYEGKTTTSRKDIASVKYHTEHGNEYQRIIQTLVRNRGFQYSDFKLGTEVVTVGDLDDIVYCVGSTWRFIQVKHEQEIVKRHGNTPDRPKISVLRELFKTTQSKDKTKYEIVRYFKSFCKIKENPLFMNSEIKEITIITNRPLIHETAVKKHKKTILEEQRFQGFLVLRDDFERDSFIYLGEESGEKYSLNTEALSKYTEFMDCLQKEKNAPIEAGNSISTNTEKTNELIMEFLKKICIVVNYPSIRKLRKLLSNEIVSDHKICAHDDNQMMSFFSSKEVDYLMNRGGSENKFLTNEDWKESIDEYKEYSNMVQKVGIVSNEKRKLLKRHESITFESDKIKDMYEDMIKFLSDDEKCIFLYNNVLNEDLAAIKTLNLIEQIENEKRILRCLGDNYVFYADLNDLIQEEYFMEVFSSGEKNTLVIREVGYLNNDEKTENIAKNLVKILSCKRNHKVIVISSCSSPFKGILKTCLHPTQNQPESKILEKSYNHNFSCLSQSSQEKILSTQVSFQGKTIEFGSLLSNNISFASSIIDENVLLKISDKSKELKLLNTAALSSPGYSETYYISRKLYQNRVSFESLKEKLQEQLFFLTSTNNMGQTNLINLLEANEISKHFIQVLVGRRKIASNGIVLNCTKETNRTIFKKMAARNSIVHWLLVCDSNLFHMDSNMKHKEDKALQTMHPLCTDELILSNSHSQQKIVIMVGDSGVGKSTVLTHVANNICKQQSSKPVWIVKSNLRVFYKNKNHLKLGDFDKTDTAINLIAEMGSQSENSNLIVKKIIMEGLKNSRKDSFNLVLLLDGFNEISPLYQKKTCSLIKTLKECNLKQIWITTQAQGKVQLEESLQVPAHLLTDLNEENQIDLMVKYWIAKYDSHVPIIMYNIEELRNDALRALQSWKKSINENDEQSFTQVAMNLIILSDILLTSNRQINWNINLFTLYETFISKKFCIHNEEISESQRHVSGIEKVKEKMFEHSIREILQELSANIILVTPPPHRSHQRKRKDNKGGTAKDPKVKLLKSMTALSQFKDFLKDLQQNGVEVTHEDILSKIGFLSIKEEIDFTHESFTQFFFSEYLFNNLNKTTVKTFFITHMFEDRFYICRKFLNNSIKKHFEVENKITHFGLTASLIPSRVETRQVTKFVKEKLAYIVILLLHWIGSKSQQQVFLRRWLKSEVSFCGEVEKSVEPIVRSIVKEDRVRVAKKMKMILTIDKSEFDNDTKLERILNEQWFTGDDASRSQD